MTRSRGYGRVFVYDPEDSRYMIRDLLPSQAPSPRKFWWANGAWLDQGAQDIGVEFAWRHYLADQGLDFVWPDGELTRRAVALEGDGKATTIRAAAKILHDARYISQYRWGFDAEDVIRTLLTKGPVVCGTNWHAAMNYPNAAGIIKAEGPVLTQHAYVLNGVDMDREVVRAKLSWGRAWGKNGYALISFSDLDQLIWENGDACYAYVNKFVRPVDEQANGSDRAEAEVLQFESRSRDTQELQEARAL